MALGRKLEEPKSTARLPTGPGLTESAPFLLQGLCRPSPEDTPPQPPDLFPIPQEVGDVPPVAPQWFYEEKDVLDIEAKEKGKGLVYSKSLICVASLGAGDSRPLLRRMLPRT